ncbi:MAG: YmdB family metallophosphoesterase, partial [Baekduiaceae bacterium]
SNFLKSQPGHGTAVVERDGVKLGVLSLQGNVFLQTGRHAFSEAETEVARLEAECDHVLVDFHAEATSEKVALGWYLDGRVTAVVGTHTHVPTNDFRVLPDGTAYITDVGMTGPRGGVIGVKREQAIAGFVTHMKQHFDTSDEDPWVMGVVIRCSEAGRADSIEPVLEPATPR